MVKDAFASYVSGCRPIMTEGVRYSACSRVNAAFRPNHAGRFHGMTTVCPSTAGYSARTVPRVASAELLGRGLGSDLLPRGTWTRSVRTSEADVSRRGNSGRPPYESEWHEDVGLIPALKGGAFSSNLRKRRYSDTHRPMSQFLLANQLTPGGLKGRGTLDEPGRRKHHREQRDRGAWFERRLREPSFVITRERRSLGRQRVLGVERAEGFLDSSIRI